MIILLLIFNLFYDIIKLIPVAIIHFNHLFDDILDFLVIFQIWTT